MANSPLIQIICGSISCSFSILFGLFVLYHTVEFYKLKNDMIYVKRRGNIAVVYSFAAASLLLTANPLLLYEYWFLDFHIEPQSIAAIAINVMSDLLYNPTAYFVVFVSVMRYWMIYYDIQFSTGCLNLKWKQYICRDESLSAEQKWYMNHRKTYGNVRYMMKRVTICTFIISSISLTCVFMFEFGAATIGYHVFLNLVVFSTVIAIFIYITCKIPNFNDHIYLLKEGKIMAYVWCTSWVIYATNTLITTFVGDHYINRMLIDVSSTTAIGSTSFVSTYWVLKHIKISKLLQTSFSSLAPVDLVKMSSYSRSEVDTNDVALTVQNILQDKQLIHRFMQQLIKEFSVECLLSLIEFQQFKQYAMESLDVKREEYESNDRRSSVFKFSDEVPLSDVVYYGGTEQEIMTSLKMKAHKLYRKYIVSGAEFEINISWRIRMNLHHLMDDYDRWISPEHDINAMELVSVFDQAEWAMMVLIIDAKKRFQTENV